MKKLLPILLCLLLWQCREPAAPEPPEYSEGVISLNVEGRQVFVYDDITCQCSFDTSGNTFRSFRDDMGEYFVISLRSLPKTVGDSVTANLEWAVGSSAPEERNNISFTVQDIDDEGYVYLWSSGSRIAAVVRPIL